MPQLAMSALSFSGHTLSLARVDEASPVLRDASIVPVSVVVAVKNEARNLRQCLESIRNFGEVVVVDSQSTDATVEIARSFAANVVQFYYRGGWPKKRQWAIDSLPLKHEWVLLLDADELVTPELAAEIRQALNNREINGYYVGLEMFFLGRRLSHCGATFYKLSLFRRGMGHFECRTTEQDESMCDMEVHEHVIVKGLVRRLKHKLAHRNVDTLARYIQKHNEYSNWEARVWSEGNNVNGDALQPTLFGSQAQRRRWLRKHFLRWPGSPLVFFFYKYVLRVGFLDGVPGFIYCAFQAIQFFHVKAKLYEMECEPAMRVQNSGAPHSEGEPHVRN